MKILPSKTLVVLSHPNHEFAIYGMVQRLRPHFIYLTDGGSPTRIAETRQGLARAGLVGNATFLNHPEDTFYQGLLEGDIGYFQSVAAQVKKVVDKLRPEQVFCDRVELYNPVHDLALPIVRRALKEVRHCAAARGALDQPERRRS